MKATILTLILTLIFIGYLAFSFNKTESVTSDYNLLFHTVKYDVDLISTPKTDQKITQECNIFSCEFEKYKGIQLYNFKTKDTKAVDINNFFENGYIFDQSSPQGFEYVKASESSQSIRGTVFNGNEGHYITKRDSYLRLNISPNEEIQVIGWVKN